MFCALLLLSACGGGGGNDGDGPNPSGNNGSHSDSTSSASSSSVGEDPVAQTLTNLNVSLAETARVDRNNAPLPEDYTPLGKNRTLQKKSELFLAGLVLEDDGPEEFVHILKFEPGVSNVQGVPDSPDRTRKMPDAPLHTGWKGSPYNHATGCDVDGDGLEETVLFWWSASDNAMRLQVLDDDEAGFTESSISILGSVNTPSWLQIACGDFNGDRLGNLVIGVADDTSGTVTVDFLSGSPEDGYVVDGSYRKSFAATQENSRLGVELVTGQLDHDAGYELVILINEVWGSGAHSSPGTGRSDYYVYDDQQNSFALLSSGRLSAEAENATYNGLTGSIALGDIDGDGLDEIVLAALTSFPVVCEPVEVIQYVLDHSLNDFANLGAHHSVTHKNDQGSGCESGGNSGHVAHIWVNTLDIDGDQYHEIQVNGEIYEDFYNASTPWTRLMVDVGEENPVPARIPNRYIYKQGPGNNAWARVTRANTTMAVGNVTADDKENVIVYSAGSVATRRNSSGTSLVHTPAVTIWGIDPLTGRWGSNRNIADGLLYAEVLSGPADTSVSGGPPIVLAINVDADGTMLSYSEGSYEVVFSEPIVHAALAAPPCYDDGTQVSADCRTSWGTGTTTGVNASISHEISVKHHTGISAGVSLPIVGDVGVEMEQTVGVSLKAEASLGYQLTRTVTYTTGPMEDTVIATVIPYDQYTYTIMSHPVYPQLVGEDMVISLPRTPRTFQINRDFYNDSLVGEGLRIDDSVFSHTIGDPSSYPTRFQMLSQAGATHIGPKDVGTSSGNQSVAISESLAAGFTTTVGIAYETTVKATGGKVMQGFTVANNTEASLGFTVGEEVTFTGTVGDMPPGTLELDAVYSFGMFVYKLNPANVERPFQVINYWVE
ncbi:hypothetical protein [Marinimicrobium alkaliphilum]|uniref:hypothetical protein n=1 Tax=Marinimicrobium alkaliphilum TaxID=2202654 RepID=UPI00130091AA|nr:hypothetical protein [Marinimicrobium alkaliphilum]